MKPVKTLVLIALAGAALLALAGSASATSLTSPSGSVYTGAVKLVSEGEIVLENPIEKFTCGWSQEGKAEQHGIAATARVNLSSTIRFPCTSQTFHSVLNNGAYEIHTDAESADGNGKVTLVGFEITLNRFGIVCTYGAGTGVEIGTLTGSKTTGSNATIQIASAAIPKTGGGGLCGEAATMTGSLAVTAPAYLDVD